MIGLFGLGLIGTALAGRLRAAGHAVIGHDPDPARQATFATTGAEVGSIADVWSKADTVILAVFDTDQVDSVLATAPADAQTTVIITSTCDPDRIAALPALCPTGMNLVEAAISGASGEVAAGTAVFLVGGTDTAVAAAAPLLSQMLRRYHHVGPLGHGSRAKLAINLILGLNRAALAEGLVYGQTIGLAPEALLQVARDSAAASAVMSTKGPLMVSGDFTPQGRIAQSAKDFGLILSSAASAGQGLPFARIYLTMMIECIAAGEGDLDNAAIIRAVQRSSASPIPGIVE